MPRFFDPVVVSSGITRITGSIAGPVTALLILKYLSLAEQGYWYTFVGLASIVNYAELGMGQVILQFAAHEHGKLQLVENESAKHHELRLKSIFRTAVIIGAITASGAFVFAFPLGYLALTRNDQDNPPAMWLGPWMLLATAVPLSIGLAFINSFLEGCQMIVWANLRRAVQTFAQLVGIAAVFTSGGKLWALGAGQIIGIFAGGVLVLFGHGSFLRRMLRGFLSNRAVSWRKEIWPLQWRYAAGWAAGPFIFGLLNPLIFRLAGPEDAGRFGLTFAVVGVVAAYSQVWTAARAAVFTSLNAASRWRELNSLYERSVVHAIATYLIGSITTIVAVLLIHARFPSLGGRLLNPLSTLVLLVAGGLALLFFSITYFVRSFKEEPFVRLAWISATLMIVLAPVGIVLLRALGAAIAYLAVQTVIFVMALQIYRRYRKRIEVLAGT